MMPHFRNSSHRLRPLHYGFQAVCLGLLSTIGSMNVHAETWTELSGKRSINAKMVGMWEDEVVLLLSDGRRVNVPLNSLNAASRIQAGDLAEELDRSRAALKKELQQAAAKQAAPAPDPLPTPPPGPEYAPPKPNLTPDQAIDTISQQIRAGHLVVIYDALPPSYRSQIDDLIGLTTLKLNPQQWDASLGQLHRIADLIVTRQNWVLSYPALHDPLSEADDLTSSGVAIKNFALPLAGLIRTGMPADAIALEKIRSTGFGPWLHERDAAIAPYLAQLMQQYGASGAQWTVVSSEEDTAILQESAALAPRERSSPRGREGNRPPPARRIEMKRVEGFWIPAAMASGFEQWVKQQTTALESYEEGQMSLSDWLGGQHATIPTTPAATRPNQPGGEFEPAMGPEEMESMTPSEPRYEEPEMMEEPEMLENSEMFDEPAMGYGPSGGSRSRTAEPEMLQPAAITPELVGTILQSIGVLGPMIDPLESAGNAAAFHQAAEQLIAPIEGMLSLLQTDHAGRNPTRN